MGLLQIDPMYDNVFAGRTVLEAESQNHSSRNRYARIYASEPVFNYRKQKKQVAAGWRLRRNANAKLKRNANEQLQRQQAATP